MEDECYPFKQQQQLEADLNGVCPRTFRDMFVFMDHAIRAMTMIEKKANDFKQRLLEMRGHDDIKNLYADRHASREEAAAAQLSGQASTVNDERPGQTTHPKLKLCFNGSLKSTIYTNKPLPSQSNGGMIEISICSRDNDDQIVTSGRLASLRVEIVALESDHSCCKGEWSGEDFDRQIRKSRDGQGSVLDGERFVELVNGRASIGNVRFKESSTGTRTREFVLAARVCKGENVGGPRIEEAFMQPAFTVLVERSKGNEKSSLPKLADKIHVLKGISRNGPYAKRLENENIHTVQDFLKALNKGQEKLQQILEIKSQVSWEATVKHARECDLKDRHDLKSYKVETDNVSLFFNCVDDLVGADFRGLYVAKDKFDASHKVFVGTQLKQAYSKLDAIAVGYVMERNHPVKISTNIDVAGSTCIPPLLLSASPKNDLCYQAAFQDAEHYSSPYGTGVHSHGLPVGDAVRNVAGQSSSDVHCNGDANQDVGQNGGVPSTEAIGNFSYHGDVPHDLQGMAILPDTASLNTYRSHAGTMDEMGIPACSPGGIFAHDDSPIFTPRAQGPGDLLSDLQDDLEVDLWPPD